MINGTEWMSTVWRVASYLVAVAAVVIFAPQMVVHVGGHEPFAAPPASAETPSSETDRAAVGDLIGRFIFRGQVPVPGFISPVLPRISKRLTDDSLIVSGKDQAVANIVVYMYPTAPIDGQPKYIYQNPLVIMVQNGRMIPRAVCVESSRRVIVFNGDDDPCFLRFGQGDLAPDTKIEPNDSVTIRLKKPRNRMPSIIDANSPGWLHCFVLVSDNPYAAATDADGRFTIKNIPVGEWQFAVGHERLQVHNVKIDGKPAEWKHHRFRVSIHSGVNSLGTIELAPESLAPSG